MTVILNHTTGLLTCVCHSKTGDIELVFPATNITCHTKTLKQYSGFLTVKIPN